MASARESICQNDPNFAVICSFLSRYGDILGIPKISFAELQTYLEETKYVSDVLIDLHVRLLRKLGKTSANYEKWERCVMKFCFGYSSVDGWEMEQLGYSKLGLNTRLRILKNLLEAQFDNNNRFKDKINEKDSAELRFLPIGRDRNGLAYWYLLDDDFNLRVYREEQDDENAETWTLVCSNRNDLAALIAELENPTDLRPEKDKLSTTSGDSDSKDEEAVLKGKVKSEEKVKVKSEDEVRVKSESEAASSPEVKVEPEKELKLKSEDVVVKSENEVTAVTKVKVKPDEDSPETENVTEAGESSPSDKEGGSLKSTSEVGKDNQDKVDSSQSDKTSETASETQQKSFDNETIVEKDKQRSSSLSMDNTDTEMKDKNRPEGKKSGKTAENSDNSKDSTLCSADDKEVKEISIGKKDDKSEDVENKDASKLTISKGEKSDNDSVANDSERDIEATSVSVKSSESNAVSVICKVSRSEKGNSEFKDCAKPDQKGKVSDPKEGIEVCESSSNVDLATRTEQSVEKDRVSVTENIKSENTLSSKNNTDISVKKTDKESETQEAKCERVADPKNSDKVSDSVCVGKGNSNSSSETVDQKPVDTIEKQGSADAVKKSQDTPDDTSKPVTEVDPSKTSCSDVNYVRQSSKPEKELSCDKIPLEKDGGKAVSESIKKGKVETEAIPADSLAQKTMEVRSGKNRIKSAEEVTESASEEAKQPHQETGASRAHVNQEKDDTVEGNNTKNKQKDLESPLKKAEILQESVKCVIKSSSKENASDSEKDNCVQSVEKQKPEASTQSSVEAQIKVKTEKDLGSDTKIQDKTSKSSETKSKVFDIDCQGDKTTTESPKTKTEDSENTGKSCKPSKVESETVKTEPDKVLKDCSDSKIQISKVSKNETVETKDTSKTADSSLKVGIESETSKSTSTSKTDNKCSSKDTSTSSPSSPLPENLPSIEVEKEKDSDKLQGDEAAECSANKECLQDTSVKSDGANAKESENCSKTVQDPDRLKSAKKVATKRKPTRSSSVSNLQKLAKNSDASDSENDKTAAECDKIASQDPAVDNTIKDTAGIPTSKEESEKGEKSEKPSEAKINEDVEKTDGVSNTEPEKGSRKQKLTVKEDVADSPAPEVEVSERTGRPLRATRSRSARGRGGFTTTSGNQKPAQTTAAARSNQRASKRQVPVETSEPSSPESEEEPVVKQARRGRVRGKGRGGNQSNQRRTQAKKPPVEESDESDDDIPLSKISTSSKSRAKRGKNQASRGGRSKTRPKADENSTPVRKSSRPRKRKKVESDEEFCVKQTRGGRSAAGGGSARKGGGNGGRSGTRRGRRIVATSDEDTDQEQEEEEERLVFEALEGGESSDALSFHSDSDSPKEESDEDYEPQKKGRNARRAAARSGEHELVSQHEGEKVESQSEIEDDTPCCKCQKSNHPEWILLCDKCDAGYHTACLRPPLMIIPEGDWFCPPCQHKSLVEKLCENLKDLDSQLKKFERLLKRKERLAYVGISLDNIVKEERKENVAPEYFDEFDDYEIKPKKKHRHSSRDRHRKRDKHRRRHHDRWERESSEETEQVFTQRTCRARASVSYQFKEYDDLINSAIQDDVKEPPPPGISRGKDMYNIEEAESKPSPVSKSKRRKKRRLTMLDDDDDGDEDEDSEEYKATDESEATPVEEEVEEDSSTEDEFKWRSIRTRRFGKPSRRSSRKGGRWTRYDADFVVDDEYDSDGSDNCRRSSRSATKRRVCYREINSEGEASEATPSTTDDSSNDSSDKKRRKRPKIQKQSKKPAKRKGVLFSDDSEEEQSKASESSAESHSASSDEDSDSNKKSEKRKKKPVLEESEEASDNSKSNSSGSDSDKSGRVKHSKRASARKVKYNRISDSETEEDQPESAETPVKSSTKAKTELNEDSGSEDSKPDKKSDSPKDDEGKDDEESDVVVPGKPRGMKFTSGNNPAVRKVSQIEPVIDQSTQDSDISESPKVSNASSNGNSVDEPGPVLELQPPNGHGFDRYTPQMPSAVYPQGYGYEGSQHPYYSNNQTDTYQPQGYFPTPQGDAPYCSPSQHSRSPHHGMPHPEHGPHYTSLPGHDIRPPTMGPNVPHREMSCPPPNLRDQRSHHPPQSTTTYQELQPPKVDRRAGMGPACPKPGGPPNPTQPRPPQPRGSFMMDSILRTKGYGEGDEDDLSDVSDLISYVTQDS